ncbi:MAG: WhiB family transcriptional regulator [Streptosporangiales bacterium]|nr:WhiB family transcriptional regulator [Streptosporangiales bacterium]
MSASARWSDSAACSTVSADLFFDSEGETREGREIRERAAKAVCAGCPALAVCLDFAVDRPGLHGLWGGMNGRERAAERRRRSRSVAAA